MKAYSSSRLAAWFAPKTASKIAGYEVVGLMLLLVTGTAFFAPDDPFLLNHPFPWLWMLPVILSLRYGTLAAFAAVLLLLAVWFIFAAVGLGGGAFPSSFFVGGLILSLVAGEFSDVWSARLRRVGEANSYLDERLDSLTRRHYLLKLSHERLEQELLVKPVTLRDALQKLRRLTVESAEPSALPEATELLRLLAQACQLEVASLHSLTDGRLQAQPVASIGECASFEPNDDLVRYALEYNTLSHVQTEHLKNASSQYLIAAPLANSGGELIGLLVVERLPFLSLNGETLSFLSVLLGYYADSVCLAPAARQIMASTPDCPHLFAGELVRLQRIYQASGMQSTLAAFSIEPGTRQTEIVMELLQQARQLDLMWDFEEAGRRYLVTLMPLHSEAALAGYLSRTERWLHEVLLLQGFAAAGMTSHSAMVSAEEPGVVLHDLLERCRHDRN